MPGRGEFLCSLGLALARKLLGLYLATVPTYSAIYGTFATLPILLLWIYICWVIFLLGAIVAAYWPSLRSGASRALDGPGRDFALALEVLAALAPLRNDSERGLAGSALAQQLHVDRLQIEPALAALTALRWVGAMPESATSYLEGRAAVCAAGRSANHRPGPVAGGFAAAPRGGHSAIVGAQWLGAAHRWRRCCPAHRAAGAAVNVNGAEEGAAI